MDKAKIIEFKINGDIRGSLVAIEGEKNLEYRISRVFYMFGMEKNAVRGKHANRKSRICFIAVNGSCKICVDDGILRKSFVLDSPNRGLVCDPMTWKEMSDFSADCVLVGICDTNYDAGEYISDYETFMKEIKKC
jgi:dTDP-4-dehydrorhamnose 3,5-epimerase-like enzyme